MLMIHEGRNGRPHGTADDDACFTGRKLVDRLPNRLRNVLHGKSRVGVGRTAIARQINGNASKPSGKMGHLEHPTGLIHRDWVQECHRRTSASGAFIIKWTLDVWRHYETSMIFK